MAFHQAAIINVGANLSHGALRSPLFGDRTFEFVPISEGYVDGLPRYSSFRRLSTRPPEDFIPQNYLDQAMHNDPEFETFTYGDIPENNSRAANLRKLAGGDSLFFLARLVEWNENKGWGSAGFYLIGKLVVDKVVKKSDIVANPDLAATVRMNAHVLRWKLNPYLEPHNFWVFVGSSESSRFIHAVPFNGELMSQVLLAADGSRLKKRKGMTDISFVGSNTRACRLIKDASRIRILEERIEGHR
ncbi:MAG: hypothetical protein JW880_05030 [Candidatus Thermoplasmatota archaeon]|nr:hypothetical protein [Candidatus Thermoplasmatota archaeon]